MLAEEQRQMEFLAGPWPLLALTAVFVAPLCEEVFFRGFLFSGLRGRLGFATASGVSAALFALPHRMPWSSVPLFCIGLACASAYERHRTLAGPFAVHAVYNGAALLVYALFSV
jgi:membrane protease YdiL (CAAX protease family)